MITGRVIIIILPINCMCIAFFHHVDIVARIQGGLLLLLAFFSSAFALGLELLFAGCPRLRAFFVATPVADSSSWSAAGALLLFVNLLLALLERDHTLEETSALLGLL